MFHHYLRVVCFISALTSWNSIYSQGSSAEEFFTEAKLLHYNGKYDSAVAVFSKARLEFETKRNNKGIIKTEYALGESMSNLGQCESAREIIKKALASSVEKFGETGKLTADGYYYLSRVEGGCDRRFEEAISLLEKSTYIKLTINGEGSSELAFDYTMMGYYHTPLGNYDSAITYLTKALEIRVKNTNTDSVELSHTLYYLARVYQRKGDLKHALEFGKQALNMRQTILIDGHPTISNSLNDIGIIYRTLGNFDQALSHYLQALEMRKRALGKDHVNVGASYYTIGNLYGNNYNYQRAIHFIEQGNSIMLTKFGEKAPVLHTYYAYLGKMYGLVGEEEKARRLLNLAERLAETYLKEDHPYLAIVYNLIGDFYSQKEDLELQVAYLKKAQKIYKKAYGEETIREAGALVKLGEASFKMSNSILARRYYNEALEIFTKRLGTKNSQISGLYQNLGDVSSDMGDFDKALDFYSKSIQTISIDTVINGIPSDINSLINKQQALRSFQKIANLYSLLYHESNDVSLLKESLRRSQFAIMLIDHIISGYQLEVSKAQLESDSREVFEQALETTYELYIATNDPIYKHEAFRIVEKSKSPILLSKIKDKEAKSFNGVSDSLLNQERDVRIELSYYRKKLRDSKTKEDAALTSNYQQVVFEIQNAFEDFKNKLKKDYPDYYSYMYAKDVIDLAGVREYLTPKSAVLEYFETESSVYSFVTSQQDFEIIKHFVSDNFSQILSNYQKSLTDNTFIVSEPKKADSLYISTASFLFRILVKPSLEQLSINAEQLIIIPDGRLSKINFNTFLTQSAASKDFRYSSLDYLLNDYDLSYAYSSTLNFRSSPNLSTSFSFAGFAPSYKAEEYSDIDSSDHPMTFQLVRDGKLPLPGAISEVSVISSFLKGKSWINENASESNFKNNSNNYSILHLAMHSLLDSEEPEYSELLFNNENDSLNDGYLTIDEIYNLDLNADLIVLSACSSGSGKLQVGEGPISFTRAFSYAGCPSVVMSMWKIPDAATMDIMIEFYKNIKSGDRKDRALRKAQLKYLKNMDNPLYQHPFFWGGFVTMGSTQEIVAKPINLKFIVVVIGIFLLGYLSFKVIGRFSFQSGN